MSAALYHFTRRDYNSIINCYRTECALMGNVVSQDTFHPNIVTLPAGGETAGKRQGNYKYGGGGGETFPNDVTPVEDARV